MVVNRILEWYRAGINPQERLPFLATYLGHRDINSTLVYITVTQDLLQQASERFHTFGAHCLHVGEGVTAMKPTDPFPRLLHAFFYDWMVQQRNASVHTIRSYRDTWRLFLRFVAQRRRRPVAQLTLGELTASEVSAFLQLYRKGTPRHDRYTQLPFSRAAQLLRLCRWTGADRYCRAVRRNPAHSDQEGADPCPMLLGSGVIAPVPGIMRLFWAFSSSNPPESPSQEESSLANMPDTLEARCRSDGPPAGPRSIDPLPGSRSFLTVSAVA